MRTKRIFAAISIALVFSLLLGIPYVYAQEEEQSDLEYHMDFLGKLIQFIEANYYEEVDIQKLIDGAYKGVFDQLDPYSIYFTDVEYEEFDTEVTGTYGGVGLQISMRDGYVTVIAPIEGTPAHKAGIKPGDRVVSIDGIDVTQMVIDKVANMMRGEPDTTVKLGILRDSQTGVIYFELVRKIVELNPVRYELKEDGIGYIRISSFNEHADEHVRDALTYFDGEGVKDIVIDLRNNPGGIIDQAVAIAEHFVPRGPVVHVDRRDGQRKTYNSHLEEIKYNLAILVNGGSASASEILAGAVQDTDAGVLVGTQTFGKGTVQTVLPLKNGDNIKITIAKYLTPSEKVIDGVGITPDVVIENEISAEKYHDELAPMKGSRKPYISSVGLDVLGAEQRLDVLGYNVGEVDGVFDQVLADAVSRFQTDKGLYPYGILDLATQEKLLWEYDEYIKNDDTDEQLLKAIEILKSKR